jgi:hypothetical protein
LHPSVARGIFWKARISGMSNLRWRAKTWAREVGLQPPMLDAQMS